MIKRWLLLMMATAALVPLGLAQPSPEFRNDGVLTIPGDESILQIDALNFLNNGNISIQFTNGDYLPMFDTSDTLNFTNHGFMGANTGFHFDTAPVSIGLRHPAESFLNDGVIESGVDTNGTSTFLTRILGVGGARTTVEANTIVSPGTFNMGFETALKIYGNDIDMHRGSVNMLSTGISGNINVIFFNPGYLDGYWGLGTNVMNPFFQFEVPPPLEPVPTFVTNRNYVTQIQQLGGDSYQIYVNDTLAASNRVVQAVFLNNTNVDVTNRVFLRNFARDIVIEWSFATRTNIDYIYLFDEFGAETNFQQFPNGIAGPRITFQPANYFFLFGGPLFVGFPATQLAAVPPGTFDNTDFTNQYSAYEALFPSTTISLDDLPERAVTNSPGRVELKASNVLDLNLARISSDNYLNLTASNHFAGSSGGFIGSPYSDLNLRVTNGTFYVTNVILPFIDKPEGTIELDSLRWTNVLAGITNEFHVLFVNTMLSEHSETREFDVLLKVTNYFGGSDSLILNDIIRPTRSLLLDANRITIATNDASAFPPTGGIDFQSPSIVWAASTPRLQYFTNHGFFNASNAVFFGGSRNYPYYNTTFNEPYLEFVNTGGITNNGSLIWAVDFQNAGTNAIFDSGIGAIDLEQAHTALLTNGIFTARANNITISSDNLVASNHLFEAGLAINLSVSQALDDGSLACNTADTVTNKNFWTTGNGFNLFTKPISGSLLATTISNTAPEFRDVPIRWAASDLGCDASGFINNSAVGYVVLDGGSNSVFSFRPATGNNAIYIDQLEFRDWTTNQFNAPGGNGDFIGVTVYPGMMVYYGRATENGVDISFKLNGKNNGRFCWVSNYNCGFYSSTNIVYPNGTTNRVNAALAAQCLTTIDVCIPAPTPCTCNPPIVTYPYTASSSGGSGSGGSGSTGGSGGASPKLPFPAVATGDGGPMFRVASYNGLFYETAGVNANSSGYFSASTTGTKSFSAHLSLQGKSYAVSGHFGSSGAADARISRDAGLRALTIHLQLDPSGEEIRGTVSDGKWTANLVAERAAFSSRNRYASASANYTLTIPGNVTPAGHSFGTVKIGTDGSVQFSGSLADDSKITQKSALSAQGFWPLYTPLYSGSGCLLSWIQVTNSSLGGNVIWVKPSAGSAKYYPSGFTNQVQASGVSYQAPAARSRVLNLNNGNGELMLYGAGLSTALTNDFRLELNNRVTDLSGNKLSLTITPSSGLFRGSVLDPNSGKSLQFQGALFEDWNSGFGYFLGSSEGGQVYLGPAP